MDSLSLAVAAGVLVVLWIRGLVGVELVPRVAVNDLQALSNRSAVAAEQAVARSIVLVLLIGPEDLVLDVPDLGSGAGQVGLHLLLLRLLAGQLSLLVVVVQVEVLIGEVGHDVVPRVLLVPEILVVAWVLALEQLPDHLEIILQLALGLFR